MPGLDKSRFINLRQSDEELLCGICLAILNEPLVTPCCSQTYCGDCLRVWLVEHKVCPNDRKALDAKGLLQPPRLVKNMLEKLEIQCEFFSKGCDKHISLGRLANHVKTCGFNPEAICKVCGEKNGDIDDHDCNNNLIAKTKSLEISNEELAKKHNAYVENVNKSSKDNEKLIRELNYKIANGRSVIEEVKEHNAKLNEENKRLKADKRAVNKRLKTMTEFSDKSNKQLNDSIRKLTDLRDEFRKIDRGLHSVNVDQELDSVVNQTNKAESASRENKYLISCAFRYRVEDVRSLRTVSFDYSPPMFAHGFKWRIKAGHHVDNDKNEYLKFFLECSNCNKSAKKWSFDACVRLKIVCLKPVCSAYERNFTHTYTEEEKDWGYYKFWLLSNVLDPQKGCSADNSIILEAVISPNVPEKVETAPVSDSSGCESTDADTSESE